MSDAGGVEESSGLVGLEIALELLKKGKTVTRLHWLPQGITLFMVFVSEVPAPWDPDMKLPMHPFTAISFLDGSVLPWTPSMSDMTATDWCVVEVFIVNPDNPIEVVDEATMLSKFQNEKAS